MIFKRVLLVFLTIVALGSCMFFWHYLTGGFRKEKIEATFLSKDFKNSLQIPAFAMKEEEKTQNIDPEIVKILDQKFIYLDQGCQTYVFQSQDGQYVIKFIRYSKYELPFWMNCLCFFEKGKAYQQRRLAFRQSKFHHSLRSYEIAGDFMKEETGVVFSHLQPTKCFIKNLQIKDRLGRKFLIDLDQSGFLLQKKVIPLRMKFLEYKKQKDFTKAKELTVSFLKTVQEMAKKKIVNCDYNCVKNSGVLENRIIFLDVGSFFWAKDKGNPSLKDQMFIFTKHFRKWAIKEYPELLDFFEEELIKFSQEE